jgi:hypothetical protein
MKKAGFVVLAVLLTALFLSCGSAPESAPAAPDSGIPDWYLNPPDAENAVFGTGSAKMTNQNLAMQTAEARARTSIAFTLKANVQAMITDYAKEAGNVNESSSLAFVESISQQMTDAKLSGAKLYKRGVGPDGTVYVAVMLDNNVAAQIAADQANSVLESEASQYAEFKAMNALERMQEQLANTQVKPTPVTN